MMNAIIIDRDARPCVSTSHAAVASQIRRIYDHIYRKFTSQMRGLKDLREQKRIDRYTYIGATERAFEEFETSFEKEIAPLLKLMCVWFVALFLSLQVMGDNGIVRTRPAARARQTTCRTAGRREV